MSTGDLRFVGRSAAFVGLTFGFIGCLEADLATSSKAERREVISKWTARYGDGLLRLFGLDVSPRGPHLGRGERYPARDGRGRGRIFVMNHRSMLDIFIDLAFIEANIVSRADLAQWPVIGLAARRVGTLFVDRKSKQSGAAVIGAMCGAVERGGGVLVYPEGTTFAGDEVRPFRLGAFAAALRAGAEIVPLGIAYGGSSASFVDEPFVAHYRRITSASRTRVALVAGEPMRAEGSVEAIAVKAREQVQALVYEARRVLEPPTHSS